MNCRMILCRHMILTETGQKSIPSFTFVDILLHVCIDFCKVNKAVLEDTDGNLVAERIKMYLCVAFCIFEQNDCDAFVCAECCKDWDILPAVPILKSIGGKFTTNNPTVFNGGNFNQGIFIAGKCQDFVDDLVEVFAN